MHKTTKKTSVGFPENLLTLEKNRPYDDSQVFFDRVQYRHYQFFGIPDGGRDQKARGKNQEGDDPGRRCFFTTGAPWNLLWLFCRLAAVFYSLSRSDIYFSVSDEAVVDQMISMASP
jgi:hypothetical protein